MERARPHHLAASSAVDVRTQRVPERLLREADHLHPDARPRGHARLRRHLDGTRIDDDSVDDLRRDHGLLVVVEPVDDLHRGLASQPFHEDRPSKSGGHVRVEPHHSNRRNLLVVAELIGHDRPSIRAGVSCSGYARAAGYDYGSDLPPKPVNMLTNTLATNEGQESEEEGDGHGLLFSG